MSDPIVDQGDFLVCDINREKLDMYGQLEFECDIQGDKGTEWVEEENITVSDLDIASEHPSTVSTGQVARESNRDIEFRLGGQTCGFGMSGWGGILKCRE